MELYRTCLPDRGLGFRLTTRESDCPFSARQPRGPQNPKADLSLPSWQRRSYDSFPDSTAFAAPTLSWEPPPHQPLAVPETRWAQCQAPAEPPPGAHPAGTPGLCTVGVQEGRPFEAEGSTGQSGPQARGRCAGGLSTLRQEDMGKEEPALQGVQVGGGGAIMEGGEQRVWPGQEGDTASCSPQPPPCLPTSWPRPAPLYRLGNAPHLPPKDTG